MTTGALPAAPYGIGTDDTAKQEYYDAINKTLSALEARSNQGIDYWKMAGNFFNPGRTGSFGEAVGNVATGIGQDFEKQREMALPLASMRAQLAGQKYQVEQEGSAMKILANALGTSPEKLQSDISSGNLPVGLSNKITPQVYSAVALRSPKVGEVAKTLMEQSTKENQLLVDIAGKNVNVQELRAKYGDDFLNMLPTNIKKIIEVDQQPQTTIDKTPVVTNPVSKVEVPVDDTMSFLEARANNVETKGHADPYNAVNPSSSATGRWQFTKGTWDNVRKINPELPPFEQAKGNKGAQEEAAKILVAENDKNIKAAGIPVSQVARDLWWKFGDSDAKKIHTALKEDPNTPIEKVVDKKVIDANPTLKGKSVGEAVVENISGRGEEKAVAPEATKVAQGPATTMSDADELASLPLAERAKIRAKRAEESDKPWLEKKASILAISPERITNENAKIQQTMDIVAKKPYIVGLLRNMKDDNGKSWWDGMTAGAAVAAAEGVHAGQYTVSLPVEKYVEFSKLNAEDQSALKTVSRNLGEIYLSSIKSGGKTLGSNPTNFEDRLYKAPMATQEDSARAIIAWGKSHLLHNALQQSIYTNYNDYIKKQGITANPANFFTEKDSPYNTILNTYSKLFTELPQY